MFKKTAVSLVIFLIFLSMVPARSSAGDNAYYNSANHYTLTVPDGWEEIPKAIIDKAVSNAMSQSSDKSDFVDFDTGFHLKNKDYFEYPYILIKNHEINTPPYNQIEKDLAGNEILDEFEKTNREYENLLSNASVKKPYLDKVRNMVFMNMEAGVQGVGKVKNLITICLGRERAIRIFFYSPESEYLQNLPIFMSILDSFKYDQGYEYSESKAGNNYSKSIWDGALRKGIIGLILGALFSILLGSRAIIKSRSKKDKN